MRASIVVPTFNRKDVLERTIESLLNQSLAKTEYEIIVVDDCSMDETPVYMGKIAESEASITYIRHKKNEGRVVTRNDGIIAARGEIVIFLDDDNVPDKNFIQAHLDCYEQNKHDKIAVMGNASYAPEMIGKSNFAKFMQSRYLGNLAPARRRNLDYRNLPARCLGTLNCSVKRTDLIEVGMFDNSFRYYGGEDEYLGQCLKEKGIRLVFADNAYTSHYDILSLMRYKKKIIESSKYGLKIIMNKRPEYIESTMLKYLIPVSFKKDKFSRVLIKVVMRLGLNRYNVYLIEHWAKHTDCIPLLYSHYLHRALIAGWCIAGLKSKTENSIFVDYEVKK
ncbi:MAG: glycosyltransferase [Smithella sp.]|jgi:glycosyltransferase involved in cell wall biosynthesis